MKVGMLTSSVSRNNGGIYEVLRSLSKSLQARPECDVALFGLHDSFSDIDSASWYGLTPKVCNTKGPSAFGYAPLLYDALLNDNLDLIHHHGIWMYPSVACNKWNCKTSKPYIISPHGMLDPWALRNSRWKKILAGRLFENNHLGKSLCIHALCDAETRAIRQYGLHKQPVCQIPNGIYLPTDDTIRLCPWTEQDGKKVLLFLGRIHPKKGLTNLLKAWEAVQSDAHDWVLGIAGWDQGRHEGELKAISKALGIEKKVHFLGPQFNDAKAACYQHASGFILPSFSEGLPMTILEAWSYGLPVLMTPQCNIPEGFAANAAISIETESHSIEEGLQDFFAMSEIERFQIGQNGLSLIKQKFTWDKVAEEMYSVYQWALGGGAPPSCMVTD